MRGQIPNLCVRCGGYLAQVVNAQNLDPMKGAFKYKFQMKSSTLALDCSLPPPNAGSKKKQFAGCDILWGRDWGWHRSRSAAIVNATTFNHFLKESEFCETRKDRPDVHPIRRPWIGVHTILMSMAMNDVVPQIDAGLPASSGTVPACGDRRCRPSVFAEKEREEIPPLPSLPSRSNGSTGLLPKDAHGSPQRHDGAGSH